MDVTFRGKRISDGQWVYGRRLAETVIAPSGQLFSMYNNRCELSVYEVDRTTVGMSTGFHDKNDKLVYEGDILQFGDKKLVVFWNGEAYQWWAKVYGIKNEDFILCNPSTYGFWTAIDLGEIASEEAIVGRISTEIIGNIFDDPEEVETTNDCEQFVECIF